MNKKLNGSKNVAIPKVSHRRAKVIAAEQDKTIEKVVAACLAFGLKHSREALANY